MTICDHLGPFGIIWDNWRPLGTIWDHVGPFGKIKDNLELLQTVGDHLETLRTIQAIWDHLGLERSSGLVQRLSPETGIVL